MSDTRTTAGAADETGAGYGLRRSLAVTVAVIVEASGAAQVVGAVWSASGAGVLPAQRGRVRVERGAASALRARKTTALRAKNACGPRVSGGR
ncbi:hypothetical protein ACH40F_18195 [Streptomyces sp. NPDC020794]|uniref:hypothetical protein n=1 Tax=unclassified Streptomyces TaxID=2593676 RepID=UPI0036EEECA5